MRTFASRIEWIEASAGHGHARIASENNLSKFNFAQAQDLKQDETRNKNWSEKYFLDSPLGTTPTSWMRLYFGLRVSPMKVT